jgi:hypothetical protein
MKATTFQQLFQQANTDFLIYDLGRRVQLIPGNRFTAIEAGETPYPYPCQGFAHLGIVFWSQAQNHFVWFFKVPLNEQSCIDAKAQVQILDHLQQQMGTELTKPLTATEQDRYSALPFVFKPPAEKLAMLHAKVAQRLCLPPSKYYQAVIEYITENLHDWRTLGLQGLADFCCRLHEDCHLQDLCTQLQHLPAPVLVQLCHCLEHVDLNDVLAQKLMGLLKNSPDDEVKQGCFRALAGNMLYSPQAVEIMLKESPTLETLLVVNARHWSALAQKDLRVAYLRTLAQLDSGLFAKLFGELLSLPVLKPQIINDISEEPVNSALSLALLKLHATNKVSS